MASDLKWVENPTHLNGQWRCPQESASPGRCPRCLCSEGLRSCLFPVKRRFSCRKLFAGGNSSSDTCGISTGAPEHHRECVEICGCLNSGHVEATHLGVLPLGKVPVCVTGGLAHVYVCVQILEAVCLPSREWEPLAPGFLRPRTLSSVRVPPASQAAFGQSLFFPAGSETPGSSLCCCIHPHGCPFLSTGAGFV